jgi:hypothetical protein
VVLADKIRKILLSKEITGKSTEIVLMLKAGNFKASNEWHDDLRNSHNIFM